MDKEIRPMLSATELVDHLESKGIKFELTSKEEAVKYLKNSNNYFRLASYRKSFPKYENGVNEGKYINLDFKMLTDLAIIDMRLRNVLLEIAIDLEHYVKVKILSVVEENFKDGYGIIEEYIQFLKARNEYDSLEREINQNEDGTYCGEIIKKYGGNYPIWAFIELITFGRLVSLYQFIAYKIDDFKMQKDINLLKDIRELRNACAHNNCILNDLRTNTTDKSPHFGIIFDLEKIGISKTVRDKKLSNMRIKQIVSLLYLNRVTITSGGILRHQKDELYKLADRIKYSISYYDGNEIVQTNLNFIIKIIENWLSIIFENVLKIFIY